MKDKELVFNIDTLMELSTRIRCLGELSDFAVDQLNFYQEKIRIKARLIYWKSCIRMKAEEKKYVMCIWNVIIEASVVICRNA